MFGLLGGLLGSALGWGSTATAVASAVGGALDTMEARDYQEGQQDSANQFNSAQAQINRDFQERMAGTQYQRAVEDMRKAGLNPMLAYSQGGNASPAGSQASYPVSAGPSHLSAASAHRSADAAQVSSAASASQAATAAKLGDATVSKVKQEVTNLETDNLRVKAVIQNLGEEYQLLVKEGYNKTEVGNQLRATVDKLRAEVPYIHSQAFLNEARTLLTETENRLKRLDVDAAEGVGNLGREAGQLRPLFEILRMILSKR